MAHASGSRGGFGKTAGSRSAAVWGQDPDLTILTNLLFGGRLTDMETAYKVMRRSALDGLRLRCVGFDIEPELTARLLRAGRRIVEVPISYNPRTEDEGKKMRWVDGVDAVYALLKCRFASAEAQPSRGPQARV